MGGLSEPSLGDKDCSVLPWGFSHYIGIVDKSYWRGSDNHPFEGKILEVITCQEHTPVP